MAEAPSYPLGAYPDAEPFFEALRRDLQLRRFTQRVPYAASITPDANKGEIIVVDVLTGDLTVANPVNARNGMRLYFSFTQDSTGGRTVSFGSDFMTSWGTIEDADATSTVDFWYDGAVGKWIQGSDMVATSSGSLPSVITDLITFDRDPLPPFGVTPGSGPVTSLDSDLLDGQHGAYYRDAGNLNAGTLIDARVAESNVTQHEAALSIGAAQVTAGAFGTGNYSFDGTVGVGIATPDGVGVHIWSGSAGAVTAHTVADELVVEGASSGTGISILGPNAAETFLVFGSPSSNLAGSLRYLPSTGLFQWHVDGSLMWQMQAGQMKLTNGSVGLPSWTYINDNTTGMWLVPSLNDLAFSVNGVEAMRFDNPTLLATFAGGITATGLILTAASATGGAGLRAPHGTAPTSPVNGDFWSTTTSAYMRINGVTQDLLAGGGAVDSVSGTANRITCSPTTGAVVVDIHASYVGQATITTLGTIGTGTWQATSISTTYTDAKVVSVGGGTGITSTGGANPSLSVDASQTQITAVGTLGGLTVTATITGSITGNAGTASAVTWGNVSGKPSTFPPSGHNQDTSTITTGTFVSARLTGSYAISVSGSSASCTGNSATATTAAACSGNSVTATTASNMNASGLSGTVASARLSGSYTGITAVGTLTSLNMGGQIDMNASGLIAVASILRSTAGSVLILSGGSNANAGANIKLFGESASPANDFQFRVSNTLRLEWDNSDVEFTVFGQIVMDDGGVPTDVAGVVVSTSDPVSENNVEGTIWCKVA